MALILEFDTLQSSWEGMNKFLFINEQDIVDGGHGGAFGSQMVCMDTIVKSRKAEVDQSFDFGRILGYSKNKWTTLVNNYVNYHYLDMVRAEVSKREKQKARMYNYTLHFSNKYGSGKDCLISLTFARRPNSERPFASFVIRTSEITKRLLFDFLLVQRIVEYVYGHNDVAVDLYAQHWYITAESFVMYNNVAKLKNLAREHGILKAPLKFQSKILQKLDEYLNHPDPFGVMFRVNKRSMLQIQKDSMGNPLSGVKSMKASELLLKPIKNYPANVLTRNDVIKFEKL